VLRKRNYIELKITQFLNLFFKNFGLGHLVLTTSDKNNKHVRILAVKEVEKLKNMIRNQVEIRRKATGTKEVDFE